MLLTILQTNPTIGALADNAERILAGYQRADARGAELVVTPELSLTGYSPRDLLDSSEFIDRVHETLHALAKRVTGKAGLIVGAPLRYKAAQGKEVQNVAILLADGEVHAIRAKTLLPTYDVFDEARYFEPAHTQGIVEFRGKRLAFTICEDLWNDPDAFERPLYPVDPVPPLLGERPDLMVTLSASPFRVDKLALRHQLVADYARRFGVPTVYVNQVGANDELVFDGASFLVNARGEVVHQCAAYVEVEDDFDLVADCPAIELPPHCPEQEIYDALVLGVRDYFQKTRFDKAIIGISGGIDSALTAAIAVDALGEDNVLGITMPTRYSSEGSVTDSELLAERLGFKLWNVPIEGMFSAFLDGLAPAFDGEPQAITRENIQARCRGVVLMAASNRERSLVLATGNKSELAVGYCTLYGDMCGALAVISDVPKTMVYRVCNFVNRETQRIPESILVKPPSAELAPGQKDEDSLPPYAILDPIMEAYVEERLKIDDIVARGFERETVERVVKLIQQNEYKRWQAAPGIRVTSKAFGLGRRMPLAASYWQSMPWGRRFE